jgi:hypothetical protein
MTASTPTPTTDERRSFRIAQDRKEDRRREFDLDWTDRAGDSHTETFACWPARIPQTTTLRVTTVPSTGDLSPIFAVFERAMQETDEERETREEANRTRAENGEPLVDPEYKRFFDFCEDKEHMIQAGVLVEIMQWMIERSTGFTTGPSRR